MNKQKQINWFTKRLQAMVWLREAFPLLFSSDIKPLKIGIRQDIVDANKEGMPEEEWISHAIRNYVQTNAYLKLMKSGALRFNLAGIPDGEVSKEDAARAKEAFNAHKNKVTANSIQIKAKRQALREKTKKEAAILTPATSEVPINTSGNASGRKILILKKKNPELA